MLKQFLKNILLREKASSERFVDHLKKSGVTVGERVKFYAPQHSLVDVTCPWLLSIGNDVKITHGVIILTHDYSWSVLKKMPNKPGRILGAQSPVSIGNNVFIGMNAIITRGVNIGDNVIIGAGSIVTKDCESGFVYAGNPAKKLMSIEELYKKREAAQFKEAKEMALLYKKRFGKEPEINVFREYFPLFCTADKAEKIPDFKAQMQTCNNFDDCFNYMSNNAPMFKSFSDFLTACFDNNAEETIDE